MTEPSVPPAADGEGHDLPGTRPARSWRRRWLPFGIFFVVGAAVIVAGFFVKLPYYLIQPGSLRPAEQRIDISGIESYETDGDVLFTTVFITQATPALLVRAWLDDTVEIRTETEMYGSEDPDESERLNFVRMDLSKLNATLVALQEVGVDARLTGDGARVLGLLEGADPDALEKGDVITAVDGLPVAMPTDIRAALDRRMPGDTVVVKVTRDESPEVVEVVLAESAQDGRPMLGIEVDVADPRVEAPVTVAVESGNVSGPSAGLAWTLAIIDRLTPDSITDGRDIAVTGEIRADGTVGEVGALPQKVAAVRRSGVDLFLYPASTPEATQQRMREIAGDEVELRPVADIGEAIEVLVPGGLELPA